MKRAHGVLLAVLLIAVACGGATPTLGGSGDGGGGGGGPTACPSSPPVSNASCSGTYACEYGTDPDVSCDTLATCSSGHWLVRPAGGGASCSTALDPSCPATFGALSQQSLCKPEGTLCSYDVARCICATHCGLVGKPEAAWCCPDAPPGGNCPSPRPRIGASCSSAGTVCDYGSCGGNVALQCTGGMWQATEVACPG